MGYLLGLAILSVIIYLSVKYKGFRYFILWVLVFLVGLYFYFDNQSKREEELSKKRISINEVDFVDLTLGGNTHLKGRIRNRSRVYTLTEIGMEIFLREKFRDTTETVGQANVMIWIQIPPMQMRDLDEYVSFSNVGELKGERSWYYKVKYLKGVQE